MKLYLCSAILALAALNTEAFSLAPKSHTNSALFSSAPGPLGPANTGGAQVTGGASAYNGPITGGPGGSISGKMLENEYYPSSPPAGKTKAADLLFSRDIATLPAATTIQGGALKTWSFPSSDVDRLVVSMTSDHPTLDTMTHEGRLLHAKVDLCQGPNNTPLQMIVKSGKGKLRPFKAIIETPGGHSSLFIRNIANLEFPIMACVEAAMEDASAAGGAAAEFKSVSKSVYDMANPKTLQGGSVVTFPLQSSIASVKVMLKTEGRPLNALIELVQGPNSIKHTIDLYTEHGIDRPFFAVVTCPGAENVIRVVNTAPVEFPLTVGVEPYVVETN